MYEDIGKKHINSVMLSCNNIGNEGCYISRFQVYDVTRW